MSYGIIMVAAIDGCCGFALGIGGGEWAPSERMEMMVRGRRTPCFRR